MLLPSSAQPAQWPIPPFVNILPQSNPQLSLKRKKKSNPQFRSSSRLQAQAGEAARRDTGGDNAGSRPREGAGTSASSDCLSLRFLPGRSCPLSLSAGIFLQKQCTSGNGAAAECEHRDAQYGWLRGSPPHSTA